MYSRDYCAPEIRGFARGRSKKDAYNYSSAIDIWSIGIICFEMLTKKKPFPLREDIIEYYDGMTESPVNQLRDINSSKEAIKFVSALMSARPHERPTAEEALRLEWLTKPRPRTKVQQLKRTKNIDHSAATDQLGTSASTLSVLSTRDDVSVHKSPGREAVKVPPRSKETTIHDDKKKPPSDQSSDTNAASISTPRPPESPIKNKEETETELHTSVANGLKEDAITTRYSGLFIPCAVLTTKLGKALVISDVDLIVRPHHPIGAKNHGFISTSLKANADGVVSS